jgi:hypothetical protein
MSSPNFSSITPVEVSVNERRTSGGLLGAALQLHSQSSSTVADQGQGIGSGGGGGGNASSKTEGATSERSAGSLLGVSIYIQYVMTYL